ncbi:hypothetical protein FWK35_00004044, partial [Aphis craccivora]
CVWDWPFDWNWVWGRYFDWVRGIDCVRHWVWYGDGHVVLNWHWVRGGYWLGVTVDDVHFLGDRYEGTSSRSWGGRGDNAIAGVSQAR